MKSLLSWSIRNTPAMNTLLAAILVVGAYSLLNLRREVFPDFSLDIILISVPYPGASPTEVEEGICQKIEEAVRSVTGIKKVNSVAREGLGSVILELYTNVRDPQRVLNEVRAEVDRIPSFPLLAEDPEIKQITIRRGAITIGLIGPDGDDLQSEIALRELAEQIRDELIALPNVNQADLMGVRPYEISVEISEETLRKYGLTLQEVAQIIRRENVELPGGTLRGDSQEVLLRGKNKGLTGKEIAALPLITRPDGTVLTVGEVAHVVDGFSDASAISRINGRPGIAIVVTSTSTEDLLLTTQDVREYLAKKKLPPGYELTTWDDVSVYVRDRLDLLARNGLQGLIIVFVLLAIFLELHLAFWVALGIPISLLGTCIIFAGTDQTLNMMSMFAFLMALGMLVDDAIVIGENVYVHRNMGKGLIEAAVDGTYEVIPSVFAAVMTTVIAFSPLFFVPGIMGKFIWLLPFGVVSALLVSLVEAIFVLPCHLAHGSANERHRNSGGNSQNGQEYSGDDAARNGTARMRRLGLLVWRVASVALLLGGLAFLLGYPLPYGISLQVWIGLALLLFLTVAASYLPLIERFTNAVNDRADAALRWVIDHAYTPLLKLVLRFPVVAVSVAIAFLLTSLGLVASGIIPFVTFPKTDSNVIEASVYFPAGTPEIVTDHATQVIEEAIRQIDAEYIRNHPEHPKGLIQTTYRLVGDVTVNALRVGNELPTGSHSGKVQVQLVDVTERAIDSLTLVNMWRKKANELGRNFPGAESVTFAGAAMGPGGMPIEFRLLAPPDRMAALEEAVERCKEKLAEYDGVFDIQDDSRPGKWEFQIKTLEKGKALGVSLTDLAGAVRAAYYGEEAMRLQRGRHEVKLMVRYPEQERRSLAQFGEMRIRVNGVERPIRELADVRVERGYSQIHRLDQMRSISITADVDENRTHAQQVVRELQTDFLPQLLSDPQFAGIQIRWEGAQEQTNESVTAMIRGLLISLIGIFALLTFQFRSYFQPLMIMAIIPFGLVGAVLGHLVMGLSLTLMSIFALVALTGVLVNDSIVLIDFINSRVRGGMPIKKALLESGRRRLRPVLLTSLTTIGGLAPITFEKSVQAQFLIPMAVTLSFGLAFSTLLVLFLVPTLYLIYSWFVPIPRESDEYAVDEDAEAEPFDDAQTAARGENEGERFDEPALEVGYSLQTTDGR
ncbi:MAG: efflux RND transporter permease subunit [Thermogutta sp.]